MDEKNIEMMSSLLKSLSHPLRLRMLCLLQGGEMSVGDLRDAVETSRANITQHLNIMRNLGIITSRKEANFIYNRIADRRVVELVNTLQQLFCS